MKLTPWHHRIEKVEYDPEGAGYKKDKYLLNSMEVGESYFHAGVSNNLISGYTAQLHKRTKRRYLVLKHKLDGIPGTLVVRVTDRGHQK
jgi:hypothetical protein